MIKPIVTYDIKSKDNPKVLKEKTRLVTDFKAQEVIDCVNDLNDTLDNLIKEEGNKRGAIGLSANQIGVDLAISAVTLGDTRYILINPEIIEEKGKQRLFRIGCFSLIEYRAMVRCNDDIVISYFDPNGNKQTLSLKGDRSCVVQHEMDHLIGDLLYDRLEHKQEDLFVPRELLYKDGTIPAENHGPLFEERRLKGLNKVMSAPVFYSSLFNDYTDYCKFVEKEADEFAQFINVIKKYSPDKGKLLEIGNGTSALSVYLNKQGYQNSSNQIDSDMIELGLSINTQNKTNVHYSKGSPDNLQYPDKSFSTAFSYELLETLDDNQLEASLKEGLRVADTYVILIPTIDVASNRLRGNERLRSLDTWIDFINKNHSLIETIQLENGYAIFVIR